MEIDLASLDHQTLREMEAFVNSRRAPVPVIRIVSSDLKSAEKSHKDTVPELDPAALELADIRTFLYSSQLPTLLF